MPYFEFFTLQRPGKLKLRFAKFGEVTKSKAIVVISPGRTEFCEKYLETCNKLNKLGYCSYVIDHRGQGLSDRLLENPIKGYIDDFQDYRTDFEAFVQKVLNDNVKTLPIHLISHSMGGAIALDWLMETKVRISSATFFAPFWGYADSILPPGIKLLSTAMDLFGQKKKFLPGNYREYRRETFEENRVTYCQDRHERNQNYLKENPQLALGDITWGWLQQSFIALKRISQIDASKLKIPVSINIASDELLVNNHVIQTLASGLSRVNIFEVEDARHEILMETQRVQNIIWPRIAHFLERHTNKPTDVKSLRAKVI